MPRRVRVLEGPLLGGPRIIAAVRAPRIVLSGTRVAPIDESFALSLSVSDAGVAFGGPGSTTVIRGWTVAAHTVVVLDGPVVVRRRTAVVDRSIAEAVTGFTARAVVRNMRILFDRRLALVGDTRVVGNGLLALWRLTLISEARIIGNRWLVGNRRLLARRSLTLVSDLRIVGDWWLTRCRWLTLRSLTLIGNARIASTVTLICCWSTVGDRLFVRSPRVAGDVTTVVNRPTICCRRLVRDPRITGTVTLVGCRSTIGAWSIVSNLTFVRGSTVTGGSSGHRTGTRSSGRTGSGSSGCSGSGFLVAVVVRVGIELIGVLELTFLLETLLLCQTITLGGILVQLLSLGLLALRLGCLSLCISVGLLRFGLAVVGVRLPSMDFRL